MPADVSGPRRPAWRRPLVALLVVAALAAAGWGAWTLLGKGTGAPAYRFAKVERGALASVVSASGTLQAVTTVQVGSQISGQIKELLVDFNSVVKEGQLLARIDPETYELKVRQAEADLEAARTSHLQRESDAAAQRSQVLRARIGFEDAKSDLERKESLVQKGFISTAERDKARFVAREAEEAIRTADAQVKSAVAQVANAAAIVKQREAALASARNDLAKTAITAPVNGVVISRQVDAGQTVAASLNTPTLFTIAQDLSKMQVAVAIDETDIGRIRPDQRVTFTVDAYAGRTFEGRVDQIRKSATTVQNVVTYTVIVSTPNPDLRLVPGMTANVRIVSDSRENVLKVANAALRWRPLGAAAPADAVANGGGAAGAGDAQARRQRLVDELKLDAAQSARVDEIFAEQRNRMAELRDLTDADRRQRSERMRGEARQKINAILDAEQKKRYAEIVAAETGRASAGTGRVHKVVGGRPVEVPIRTGLTDGNATEVVSGALAEGDGVIVGTQIANAAAPKAGSGPRLPF
ncbi:Macrolide export protein MacA [Burkholderiales bacterium]|nr:Macrolide export protein MacA [Burkholderiales bacterium]